MIEREATKAGPKQAGTETEAPAPSRRPLAGPGNAATLARLGAQAKLTVGAANDPAEREADAVARRVVASLSAGGAATAEAKPSGIARSLRRRTAPGAAPIGAEGGEVEADTERALESARSSGTPLPEPVRRSMETAFDADFSGIRTHVGAEAETLSRSLGAEAFTTGNDVFFRRGLPDTSSRSGQELLAHELAHTVQQGAAPVSRKVQREVAEEEETEIEAEEGEETVPEELLEEQSGESESEGEESTEGEGAVTKGSLPEMEAALPALGPPAGVVADTAGRPRKGASSGSGSSGGQGAGGLRLVLGDIGVSTSTSRNDAVAGTAPQEDGISASAKVTTATSGGLAVTPFGAMQPDLGFRGVKYEAKTGFFKGNYIKVSFDLFGDAQWGTTDGGRTDVASGSSNVITADNYEQIVSDLTPELQEKSWRAPRTQFWSEAICARHEKYHATDFQTWLKGAGKTLVQNELGAATVDLDETTRQSQATIETETAKKVNAARVKLINGYVAYMQGSPVASYLSMPSEKRAFGDGKKPYLALAAAVKKTGKKLADEASA